MDKKVSNNRIWIAVSFVLAILTIHLVLKQSKTVSFKDITRYVTMIDKTYLILAIISSALFVLFEAVAIGSILRKIGYEKSKSKCLLYSTSDIYFSAVTPSATGGQPASAFFMVRDGIPVGVATVTLILNLMMYTFSILFLGLIALIIDPGVLHDFGNFSRILISVAAVFLLLLVLIFYALLKKEEIVFGPIYKFIHFLHRKRIVKDIDTRIAHLEKTKNDYKECSEIVSSRKGILMSAFIWNLLQRAFQMAVPMLIFAGLGGPKSRMTSIFAKQCLITIGFNFVPIPGGMGISDYLMVDGFNRIMGRHMAFVVEMISRGMTFYICVLLSGIITLIGYYAGKRRKNET